MYKCLRCKAKSSDDTGWMLLKHMGMETSEQAWPYLRPQMSSGGFYAEYHDDRGTLIGLCPKCVLNPVPTYDDEEPPDYDDDENDEDEE
jgi:hypothetical protein